MSNPPLSYITAEVSGDAADGRHSVEVLAVDEYDEYEKRRVTAMDLLKLRMGQAGVPKTVSLDSLLPHSAMLTLIHEASAHASEDEILYQLRGSDLPELLPSEFAKHPVWYLRLSAQREHHIPAFLRQERLDSYMDHTGDPWVHASRLLIATGEQSGQDGESQLWLACAANAVADDISQAAEHGFILVIYACAMTLHLTAIAVDEVILIGLQAEDSSSFARPSRVYSAHKLQARTRAVEETGIDPETPGSSQRVVLPVHTSITEDPRCARRAPAAYVNGAWRSAGIVSWASVDPAGIGKLKKVVRFVPPDLQGDTRLWLRNTVAPELFVKLTESDCRAWVERVVLNDRRGTLCYVVIVRSGAQLALVAMVEDDSRFAQAFDDWSARGECPLALENYRNGRLFTLPLAWPVEFTACIPDEEGPAGGSVLAEGLHRQAMVRNIVERIALNEKIYLKCHATYAVDEQGWVMYAELNS